MSSARKRYTDELAKRFGGYYAAWTPGDHLQLGDIGMLEGKSFKRIGNIADLGLTFERRADPTPETLGPYKSSGKVTVDFKAAGAAQLPNSHLAQADAGFSIRFAGEHAVVFIAEGCFQPSIADQLQLGRDIIALFKEGRWNSSWHVITQLVEAASMTVLISSSSNGGVDLKVTADIDAAIGAEDLAKAELGLKVQASRVMETTLLAQKGATPMFRLSRMRKPIFGKPNFKMAAVKPSPALLPELPLEAITPGTLKAFPQLEEYLTFGEAD